MRLAHYAGSWGVIRTLAAFTSRSGRECAFFGEGLDAGCHIGIMQITQHRRLGLPETPREDKASALRRHHALNHQPHAVSDSAFTSSNAFFDSRDLVQVKYEMLRRVRE